MQGIRFDGSVSLGHLLTILTMVVGMAGAYAAYRVTLNDYDTRLRHLEKQGQLQAVLNDVLTSAVYSIKQDVAVIKDRLERVQK